jgi:hypothetical protein
MLMKGRLSRWGWTALRACAERVSAAGGGSLASARLPEADDAGKRGATARITGAEETRRIRAFETRAPPTAVSLRNPRAPGI